MRYGNGSKRKNRKENHMHKKYRFFRWFMVLVLTISTVTTGIMPVSVAAATFTDVPKDAYFAESVGWAVDKVITK